jgi:hypothetical protein
MVGPAPMSKADLASPLLFRNDVRAPNRLALTPMTNVQSHDMSSR